MYPIRHTTQKFVHTEINTYSNEMNTYKDFYIFACMSVIKTCVTGLFLKDKNAQHRKSSSFSSQIALMSL